MTHKTIKEIIRTFLFNDVPDSVRDSFETWMLDKESISEKDEALESLWEEFDSGSIGCKERIPDASVIIEEAESLHSARKNRKRNGGTIALWFSSVAAAVLAVISIVQFFSTKDSVICLASSECSKASFVLPDGSKVWLNMDSRLYYKGSLDGRKREVRLEGEGYFDVAKSPDRPFIVNASGVDISVLGTQFTVTSYNEDKVDVYLQEGKVRINGPGLDRDGIMLAPGEAASYDGKSMSYNKKNIRASNHTSWINDKLQFSNVSLNDIIDALNHRYHKEILCDPKLPDNIRLSLTVRQEPLNEILTAICTLAKVKYTTNSDGTILITR